MQPLDTDNCQANNEVELNFHIAVGCFYNRVQCNVVTLNKIRH